MVNRARRAGRQTTEESMENGREVVVLSGVRTAIGDYGGSLKDLSLIHI